MLLKEQDAAVTVKIKNENVWSLLINNERYYITTTIYGMQTRRAYVCIFPGKIW